MEESPLYFEKYLESRFANIDTKIDSIHKEISAIRDLLSRDISAMSDRMSQETSSIRDLLTQSVASNQAMIKMVQDEMHVNYQDVRSSIRNLITLVVTSWVTLLAAIAGAVVAYLLTK